MDYKISLNQGEINNRIGNDNLNRHMLRFYIKRVEKKVLTKFKTR